MRKHEKKTEPEPANAGPEAEMMSIPRTEYAEPATEPEAALDDLDEKDADLLVDDQSPLTENEKQEKAQAEAAIQKNGVSNGVEFLKLKRGKLFRADFKSFGAYHKAVFPQYKRSTIFYWMGLAKAIEKVADPELATAKQNVIAAMGKKTDEEIEHIQQRREETAKAWNEMTAGDVDTMAAPAEAEAAPGDAPATAPPATDPAQLKKKDMTAARTGEVSNKRIAKIAKQVEGSITDVLKDALGAAFEKFVDEQVQEELHSTITDRLDEIVEEHTEEISKYKTQIDTLRAELKGAKAELAELKKATAKRSNGHAQAA